MKFLTEGLLHSLCLCFDIVFAQLGVISRTRNEFVERVAVAERWVKYLENQNLFHEDKLNMNLQSDI